MGNSKSNHHNGLREMPPHVKQLHYAVMTNDKETVDFLIEKGVNVNFPWYNPSNPSVKDGATPLLIAVSLNHTEIIGALLSSGAYINKCDRQGCTPVYKAAFHGRPCLIEYLSKSGADVNLADYVGKTPLYICVNNCIVHTYSGKTAVQKLISAGAIVDKRDKVGQGPIHMASRWKLCEIVKMLISAQSDVNLVDKKGCTPLYMCVSCLSTKLYHEDLRHQLPCIIALHRSGADMLNFVEWLHFKGPGFNKELLNNFADSERLWQWYLVEKSRPQTLRNMCRKVIQKSLCQKGPLTDLVKTLPLPSALRQFTSRRTFFRDQDCYGYKGYMNGHNNWLL